MHFPARGEEQGDVGFGEEIRGAVRTVEYAQFPVLGNIRPRCRGNPNRRSARPGLTDVQYIACDQRPPAVTAELTQGKRRAASQVIRHIDAAPDAEVSAAARAENGAEAQYLAGENLNGSPKRHRHCIQLGGHGRSGQADQCVGIEPEGGTRDRNLERRSV